MSRWIVLGQVIPWSQVRHKVKLSVPNDLPAPPSLQNILKELADDIGVKPNHDLTAWAQQGVLLAQCLLTGFPAGVANSRKVRFGAIYQYASFSRQST